MTLFAAALLYTLIYISGSTWIKERVERGTEAFLDDRSSREIQRVALNHSMSKDKEKRTRKLIEATLNNHLERCG